MTPSTPLPSYDPDWERKFADAQSIGDWRRMNEAFFAQFRDIFAYSGFVIGKLKAEARLTGAVLIIPEITEGTTTEEFWNKHYEQARTQLRYSAWVECRKPVQQPAVLHLFEEHAFRTGTIAVEECVVDYGWAARAEALVVIDRQKDHAGVCIIQRPGPASAMNGFEWIASHIFERYLKAPPMSFLDRLWAKQVAGFYRPEQIRWFMMVPGQYYYRDEIFYSVELTWNMQTQRFERRAFGEEFPSVPPLLDDIVMGLRPLCSRPTEGDPMGKHIVTLSCRQG
jgi:hypothetical protein